MATIQYRHQILARNKTMSPRSGGTVRYRFTISEGLDLEATRLAIETPELWNVKVNGKSETSPAAIGGLTITSRLFRSADSWYTGRTWLS